MASINERFCMDFTLEREVKQCCSLAAVPSQGPPVHPCREQNSALHIIIMVIINAAVYIKWMEPN